MNAKSSIGIVGGGAWGTALGHAIATSCGEALLYARNAAVVDDINARRVNATYLPDAVLAAGLRATGDMGAVAARDVVLLVAPAQQTRAVCLQLRGILKAGTPLVICSKGIEQASGKLLVDVVRETLPEAVPVVFSGPSFATDVVRDLPAALTIACDDADLGRHLAETLGSRTLRIYWTDDVTGVQIGGAVKNVLAIAAGILDGRGLGASAHAALVTRGFAELARYAEARGARRETLMGLSGLGDLLLTCGSPVSRNISLGRALGQGQTLDAILGGRKSVSEGVYTATAVAREAAAKGIDMPIATAVADVVTGLSTVDQAITALMSRPFRAEGA